MPLNYALHCYGPHIRTHIIWYKIYIDGRKNNKNNYLTIISIRRRLPNLLNCVTQHVRQLQKSSITHYTSFPITQKCSHLPIHMLIINRRSLSVLLLSFSLTNFQACPFFLIFQTGSFSIHKFYLFI